MQTGLFFALLIAALAILFALQNSNPVKVNFLFWPLESSLALVLVIALAAGALISSLISLPTNLKARWTIRQQRKKITEMETALADTRRKLDELQAKPEAPALPPPADPGAPAGAGGENGAAVK
ncbi:MAG: lipopolysaccharide assembly LapA domain-containing protein [Chloroflexota bacterium]